MSQKIKREIEIVRKTLELDPNPNYRFSTWGEFNSGYLIFLSETEQRQYWHLIHKFAVIHAHDKQRNVPSIHGDVFGFQKLVDTQVKELEK
jgi:hypothetical protein